MRNPTKTIGVLMTASVAISLSTAGCFDQQRKVEPPNAMRDEQIDRDVLAREVAPTAPMVVDVGPPPAGAVDVDGVAVAERAGERQTTIVEDNRPPAPDSDASSTEHADPQSPPEPEQLWNGR